MQSPDFVPLYVRIERFLRDEIGSGRLRPGDRTPSEHELASRFGTTRATVTRALQTLAFERLIVRRSGSGTFVADQTFSAPIDSSHVRSFEEQIVAAGACVDYEVIGFNHRVAAPPEAAALHLDVKGKIYGLDRLRIVDERPMSVERRIIPDELGRRMTLEMLRTKSIHRILDEDFSLRVHRVEGKIRADLAKGRTADQLGVKRGSPVLMRDYILFSVDRRPLLMGESVYRNEFQIDYLIEQNARAS